MSSLKNSRTSTREEHQRNGTDRHPLGKILAGERPFPGPMLERGVCYRGVRASLETQDGDKMESQWRDHALFSVSPEDCVRCHSLLRVQ